MERYLMLTDRLKKNTQSLHDKIEQNHFMEKLQTKSFSKEDYTTLLKIFYTAHAMIEGQLYAFTDLEMKTRERLSLLRADLLSLGCNEASLKKSLECDLELNLNNLSKAYGALYVIEGSRMGGMFLSKMIADALGDVPLSYFKGVGSDTVSYVQHLKDIINEKEDTIINSSECIQSARDTFVFIDYAFECAV